MPLKETNGPPGLHCSVPQRRTTGSSTPRERQDDGACIVVRGRESRLHGEGRQVIGYSGREAREMRTAETVLNIIHELPTGSTWKAITGEPDEWKHSRPVRREVERKVRTLIRNSLAAYPTCAVRRAEVSLA